MQIKAFASTAATALASALLVFAANPATAQKVYRIVGPDVNCAAPMKAMALSANAMLYCVVESP